MKDSRLHALSGAIMLTMALSACAPFKPGHHKSGVCNELNSQLIFGGNTANSRQADIQKAEMPMVEKNYHKDGCVD